MLIFLPIILPLVLAALCASSIAKPRLQRWVGVLGSAGLCAVSIALAASVLPNGITVAQVGNWEAPFGITLVADGLSVIMVLMSGIIALVTAIFSGASIKSRNLEDGYYFLFFVLLAGVNGAFLTGDLFNLYVWFEVLLIASFVLMVLGGKKEQIDGAIKYLTMNLLGSVIFLSAVGIIYGKTGTLNMADLAERMPVFANVPLRQAATGMLLVAFGVKAGAFPLFSWLPASYHTPPHVVTTFFSALLTKVGVYVLIRTMTLIFAVDQSYFQPLFLTIAALTMVTGVLGAVAQYDIRKLLSFHIVSQIGYLLFGLALFTVSGIAASIFFMVHVMAAKGALFVVGAMAERIHGTSNLKKLGGLSQSHPDLAVIFAIAALSLAGLPPFSGFIGKLALVQAGLEASAYITVGVSLAVSILTLYSMAKIWNEAFSKPLPEELAQAGSNAPSHPQKMIGLAIPAVTLAAFSIVLSVAAQPCFTLIQGVAGQLMDPSQYINAVLGGEG